MSIEYRAGYKYQLVKEYYHVLPDSFTPTMKECETVFVWYNGLYTLIIRPGYAWDGPSGPTVDTKNFMRGSLVHDALYELIRLGHLDKNIYRILADRELYRLCRLDGMSRWRAAWTYYGVRVGGNPAARLSGEPPVLSAP